MTDPQIITALLTLLGVLLGALASLRLSRHSALAPRAGVDPSCAL